MMKKLLAIFAIVISLLACDNDENVKSLNFEDSAFGVVGRWYAENNTNDQNLNMFGEYVFTTDGVIYIDEYRRINGYKRSELRGVYTINSNSITTGFDFNEGGQSTSSLTVIEELTFSASFRRFSEDYTLTFQRIVGEIALMVGDTLNVAIEAQKNIEAYTSKPVEIKLYSMNDDAIASVDDDGLLTAKLIGVTYLKVETSIGVAVIKVSVSDKGNRWNDFSKVLGRDFNDVAKILGKHYVYKSDDSVRYYYDSPYVDSVDVYRIDNRADSIIVSFCKNTTEEMIVDYLRSKLDTVKTEKDLDYHWFTDNTNYLFSTFSAKYFTDKRKLIYIRLDPEWNDRIYDYGMSFDDLVDKYGNYSKKPKDKSKVEFNNIKNDFVSTVTYYLNPTVYQIVIFVNSEIKPKMLENYLQRNFKYLNPQYPYAKNIRVNGKELLIWVSIDSNNYRLITYTFEEQK